MKDLTLLRKYAGRENGQHFPASDWNGFIEDIILTKKIPKECLATGKIEYLKYTTGEWEELTQEPIVDYSTIRLSGYFDHSINFGVYDDELGLTPFEGTIILNNCCIVSDSGKCINISSGADKSKVVVAQGTKNYLIQESDSNDHVSNAAIFSDGNLTLTGAGFLYIENAVGHGVKASELYLHGDAHVFVSASHDAFHGTQKLDLYNGNYYILDANDAFGSGAIDTGEEGKLRGIVRVFGGKVHVHSVNQKVFDAKYEKAFKTIQDGHSVYYIDESEIPSGVDVIHVLHSGIHSFNYVVDGHGITNSNLSANFGDNIPKVADASVTIAAVVEDGNETQAARTVTPTITQEGNNEYLIDATALGDSKEVIVTGFVKGTIICSVQSTEVHLVNAMIEAPKTGDNAGIAIKYNPSSEKKNVQVQSDKGSEGNYIFGSIVSNNNVKLTPKDDSVIYIEAEGVGVSGSTIVYNNGAGTIYICNCEVGCIGTEQWIGNDDEFEEGKNLKGHLYVQDNTKYDIVARNNSAGTKKGFFYVTADFEGEAFADKIRLNYARTLIEGEPSGRILGDAEFSGKLYYKECVGCAVVASNIAVKYSEVRGDELINEFI